MYETAFIKKIEQVARSEQKSTVVLDKHADFTCKNKHPISFMPSLLEIFRFLEQGHR